MHRTVGDSYGMSGSKRIFRQENMPSYEATQLDYTSANAWQEEIAQAIEGAGIVLNASTEAIADMHQLDDAIQARVAAEAAVRNGNDRVTNGDLVRDQVNRVNEQAGLSTLLSTLRAVSSQRVTGFQMALISGPPYLSIILSTGSTRASNGDAFIYRNSGISKRIDAVWTAGTGNGGRAGALTNGTWYHYFVIRNNTGPYVVDAGYDTNINAVNLLAASGYTYYRRIGSVYYVDGATGIQPFVAQGDMVLWNPSHVETAGSAVPTQPTVVTRALRVPPVALTALLNVIGAHTTQDWRINLWDGLLGSAYNVVNGQAVAGAAGKQSAIEMHVRTSDGNLYYTEVVASTSGLITIGNRGYIDERQDF